MWRIVVMMLMIAGDVSAKPRWRLEEGFQVEDSEVDADRNVKREVTNRPSLHPCDQPSKGGCTQLCKKDGELAKCSCNTNYILASDHKTCNKAEYKNQIVKCLSNGNGISVELSKGDYSMFPDRTRLRVGTCKFNADGTIEADAKACGIKEQIKEETIVYTTEISDVPEETMITRNPSVRVTISCTFCCTAYNQKSSATYDPNIGTISGSVYVHGSPHNYQLLLTLLNTDGSVPKPGQIVTTAVDETLRAKVTIQGAPDDVKVRADKCWTIDKDDIKEKLIYILMENSCPVDDTFADRPIDEDVDEELTFAPFAYVKDRGSRIEIHCNLVACKKSDDCGVCVKNVKNRRRRRNVSVITSQVAVTELDII